ncbi:transcription factor bHLH87 isoform X2 [Punica granatum]|nr:transcription factor bHLH87 isoform X2 [Punica granatum]OWM77108.1 hypothetical protein CDL15_Pgr013199 [Punica granatum]PKI62297.1 hypothetical protein CRG98_017298 [Punica granatum]
MECFVWDGLEVTECMPLWSDDTLGRHPSRYGPAPYDVIDSIPHQIDLQRAQASLIEYSNSARLVQSNNQVHCSVLIAPTSQSTHPILSSCMNLQPVGTPVAVGPADNGPNVANSSTKDSLDMFDCLFSATNGNTEGSVEECAMSSSMILRDVHSRSFWNFGSCGAISSGESENNSASLQDNKAKGKEGTNKRKNNVSEGGFRLISEVNPPKSKRVRSEKSRSENQNLAPSSSNISFQLYPLSSSPTSSIDQEPDQEAIAQMKEMIYRAAAFRPVNLGLEVVEKPKRKNVRISRDPQTVAARQRREKISERIRVLQRLVPGGTKMDTASMLDEAANYLKFLQSQIKQLENLEPKIDFSSTNCLPINNLIFSSLSFNHAFSSMQVHPFPLQQPDHSPKV